MLKKLKLLHPNALFALSILLERTISFLVIPILGRKLTPELYAVWSQLMVTIGIVTSLLLLSTPTMLVPYLAGASFSRKKNLFRKLLVLLISTTLVLVIITKLFLGSLTQWIFVHESYWEFTFIIPLFVFSEAFIELVVAFYRASHNFKVCSTIYIGKYLIRFIVISTVVTSLMKTMLFAVGLFVVLQFIWSFIFFLGFFTRSDERKNKQDSTESAMLPLLKSGAILSLAGILSWTGSFLDRYLISHYLGLETLSPYAIAYSITATIAIIYTGLNFTLFPKLAQEDRAAPGFQHQKSLQEGLFYYLCLAAPAAAALGVLGPSIARLLARSQAIASQSIFTLLAIAILIFGVQQVLQIQSVARKSLKSTVFPAFASAIISLTLNMIFIRSLGLVGAAMVSLVTAVCGLILTCVIQRASLSWDFLYLGIKPSVCFVLVYLTMTFSEHTYSNFFITSLSGLCVLGAWDYFSGNILFKLITKIFEKREILP